MPTINGAFLTGRKAALPDAARGRVALIALGFTYESRFEVEAWVGRFREEFDHDPRVTFFEVPVIGGVARAGKWFIDAGMRSGTPRKDQENVITVYGGSDIWKRRVAFESPNAAYLILIDGHGVVRWTFSGQFSKESYAALASRVAALLAG